MRKVMTIVGTRPELIKMSRIISLFDQHTDHVLVHTGQNYDYGLNQVFFEDLEIRKPDFFLEVAESSAAATIAKIIEKSDEVLGRELPEALLLYGDTNSCLSVIEAKRRQIPIFHMEAGNRCFDQRVPEESNRKIVDHLSDINMVLTEHARRYLIGEGVRPEKIIKTGSHMEEVLGFYREKILNSMILERLQLEPTRYILFSAHREENVDDGNNLRSLIETLDALAIANNLPIIVSTHPRTRKRLASMQTEHLHPHVRFFEPFGFLDYIKLQMNAKCVVSDSGTLTEESALLGFPAVMIRNAHERPEGMDSGTLIMSGLGKDNVLNSVEIVTQLQGQFYPHAQVVQDYKGGAVSEQVLKVVMSYQDYINRTVWYR